MADVDNAFKINGTSMTMQPSEHGWVAREKYGVTGDAHYVYPAVRKYQLRFNFISASDFNQFVTFYNTISQTGTITADLPEWGVATYQFRTYSGCTLTEPEFSGYFENYFQEASMMILNIRT